MKIDKNTLPRWFKSLPLPMKFAAEQIDEKNGILKDVVMCQVGAAKGHGVHLEQEFINDLVAYDNANHVEAGVKARFGHPAMSDTTMGKQMGVFRNFRVRDNQAIADLHLLDSAEISPTNPGIKSWMMSMAKENSEFVMSSIVFSAEDYYQYDDAQAQVRAYHDDNGDLRVDDFGNLKPRYSDRDIFVKFGKKGQHFYTDIVEAGAATESLFAQQFNQDKFAVQAIEFVQENTALHTFLKENPAKLVEFCKPLGIVLPASSNKFSNKLTDLLFGKDKPEDEQGLTEELKTQFQKDLDAAKGKFSQFKATNAQTIKELTARAEKAESELKAAQAKIDEWGELIPTPPTQLKPGGQEPPVAPKEETPFAKKLRLKAEKYQIKKD